MKRLLVIHAESFGGCMDARNDRIPLPSGHLLELRLDQIKKIVGELHRFGIFEIYWFGQAS